MKMSMTEKQMREMLWEPYNICSMVAYLKSLDCLALNFVDGWDSSEYKKAVDDLDFLRSFTTDKDFAERIGSLVESLDTFLDDVTYKEEEAAIHQAQESIRLINVLLSLMHEEENKEEK